MMKKMMMLATAFSAALYADVILDIHVTAVKDGQNYAIDRTMKVEENKEFEVCKNDTCILTGKIITIDAHSAKVEFLLQSCHDDACEVVARPTVVAQWNTLATVDLNESATGDSVHIECTAELQN